MAETATTIPVRPNETAGHLQVHLEGAHPVEVPFLFEEQQKRLGPAFIASLAYHVVMIALVILAIKYSPKPTTTTAVLPEQAPSGIIWLSEPGPGGGDAPVTGTGAGRIAVTVAAPAG